MILAPLEAAARTCVRALARLTALSVPVEVVLVFHSVGERGMHTACELHEGKLDGLLQDCRHGG